jgi:hypothetical protein
MNELNDEAFTFRHQQGIIIIEHCRNPILREVWGRHSHSRKWELESSGIPENSEDNCKG